jgi:hypothetical protein
VNSRPGGDRSFKYFCERKKIKKQGKWDREKKARVPKRIEEGIAGIEPGEIVRRGSGEHQTHNLSFVMENISNIEPPLFRWKL